MDALHTLWEWLVNGFEPLLWFIGGYVVVRLLLSLARRRRVTSHLVIVGHALPFLTGLLLAAWSSGAGRLWPTIVGVLQTLTLTLLAFVVLHALDRLLTRYLESQGRPNGIPRLMRDIGRGILLVLALFMAISQFFHVAIGTVLLSSTVFTAIVGFALQDLLKNVFAGIALQIERPFLPGDWIFIDQNLGFGRVLEMSWRAIRVRPRDGQVVVIPNSIVAAQQITNLSATGQPIAMRLRINVDAQHPPNKVSGLLKQAVLSIEGVVEHPHPFVYTREITAATVAYEVKLWVQNFEHFPEQQGDAMARIWYILRRNDIHFAPNEIVLTRPPTGKSDRRMTYTLERIARRLRQIPVLDVLTDREVLELAGCVEIRLFATGEILAHEGQHETTLYAIIDGSVRVEVAQAEGEPLVLTTLGPGEVFGERGMLMDEPRSASVIATEDTRAVVIDRFDLLPFFEQHPELPERLAAILSERMSATSASVEEYQRAEPLPSRSRLQQTTNRSLAERIRRALFSLGE